jgi:hypothetical protein
MFAQGLSEILTGFVLSDPATSLADAAVIDVPDSDAPPTIAFAASKAGVAALTAAGLAPGSTTPLGTVAWDKAAASIAPSALLAGARPGKHSLSDIATLFHECGFSCFVYVALGNSLQLGAEMQAMLAEQLHSIPTGFENARVHWGADNMIALVRGDGDGNAKDLARPPVAPVNAAESCLRTALVGVRAALRMTSEQTTAADTAIDTALHSLDGATECTAGDAAVAARQHTLHDALVALKTKLAAKPAP